MMPASISIPLVLGLLLLGAVAVAAPPRAPPPPPPPPGTQGGACCTAWECVYNNATVPCAEPHNQCCTIEGNWASPEGVCYDNRTEACAACPVENPNHPVSGICPSVKPTCCAMYQPGTLGCIGAEKQCCHHEGEEDAWSCAAGEICCGFPPEWNPQGVSANHSCCKNSTTAREVCVIDPRTGHGSCQPLGAPATCGGACADSEDCAAGGSACGSCTRGPDGYSVCMHRHVATPSAAGASGWTTISLSGGPASGTSALTIEVLGGSKGGGDGGPGGTVVALDVQLQAQGCGDPESWLVINERSEWFDTRSPWTEQDITVKNSSSLMYTQRVLLSNLQTNAPVHVAPLGGDTPSGVHPIAVLPYRSRGAVATDDGGLPGPRASSCFVTVSLKRVDSAATNNTLQIDSSASPLTTDTALAEGALLLFNFSSEALNLWDLDGSGNRRLAGVSGVKTPFSVAISGVAAVTGDNTASLNTSGDEAGGTSPCSIMTMGLDYRTCTYEPCRLEDGAWKTHSAHERYIAR
jgi:hypothetical protein